jgi:nucleotide-binding universal stress UspA family protein
MSATDTSVRVQFSNILFLTDFSPASTKAIPYVDAFVKRFGAKLYALHVRPPVINPMTRPAGWAALEAAAKWEDQLHYEELNKAFPALQPTIAIQEGNFFDLVAHEVKSHRIDLIIIGSHGRTGPGKFLLGSTAEEIFRSVRCSVLTIGPNATERAPQDCSIKRILYPTDLSAESRAAAPLAVSLAEEFQARITLAHVVAAEARGDLVMPADVVACSMKMLQTLVPTSASLWCDPSYDVEVGDAAEKIVELATKDHADLIVMGVRKPAGFPGAASHLPTATAHKVVVNARCAVLTFRV